MATILRKGTGETSMKIATSILLVFIMAGCDSQPRQNAQSEIIALERSALDQWAKGNASGYIQNAAEDFTYFDDIAAQGGVDGIDAARKYFATLNGKIPPHTYEMVNARVQVYDDIGILTFQWHATTADGKPLNNWKASVVYRRTKSGWKTVHANWSLIKKG
jgi:ketosteroid isomerase-like protein